MEDLEKRVKKLESNLKEVFKILDDFKEISKDQVQINKKMNGNHEHILKLFKDSIYTLMERMVLAERRIIDLTKRTSVIEDEMDKKS